MSAGAWPSARGASFRGAPVAQRAEGEGPSATLRAQQRAFQRRLLVAATEGGCAGAPGMAIYAQAYRARLAEALRTNYPVLHRVVGDRVFDDIAAAYLAVRPSAFRSIRWFGDALADFLARRSAEAAHPCLSDLARFEWAVSLAFDGPDAAPIGAGRLVEIPPERWAALRFALHPTLQLLDLAWAVEPVWRALGEDPAGESPPPAAHAHVVRVWRRAQSPCWRSIDALERTLLADAASGACFGALCERIAAHADDPAGAAGQAATLLHGWLADGLVVGLG